VDFQLHVFIISHCPAHVQAQDGSKNVPVGSLIAIMAEEGDDLSGAAQMASDAASAPPPPPKEEKTPQPPKVEEVPEPTQAKSQESKPVLTKGERIFASPIAKKIALERGIPLAQLKGTGPEGRIIREDVEKYQPPTAAASATTAASSLAGPATPSSEYTDTPVSNMRRVIGSRLTQSKQELPHYYLTVQINMDKVMKLREVFNKTLGEKDKAAKLSVNDFILKAVACALNDVPEANSAWLGEVIRQ
jgi:pyruvate dehydrogenase E2 component (dihydrolipoamide acetyltransferase)